MATPNNYLAYYISGVNTFHTVILTAQRLFTTPEFLARPSCYR